MTVTDIALRSIGAFYAFAGFIVVRVALSSRLIDQAIAALGAGKPDTREDAQALWHLASAVLVFASGVTLMLLLDVSAWIFLGSAAGQAAYLIWLAPRYFDLIEPPDPAGRRQTTNAFVIYAAATSLVWWAALTGRLQGWQDVPWPWLAAVGAAIAALITYAAWTYTRPIQRPASPWTDAPSPDGSGTDGLGETLDLSRITRVKIMCEHGRYPLWALDELYGDIAPQTLGLSPRLCRDLGAWAEAFDRSFDPEDPMRSPWSDAECRAHEAAARPLGLRVKQERPDLTVYVVDRDIGIREISPA